MKLNATEIKRFLTKTGLFSEEQLKIPIRQIKISKPLIDTTLISFVWKSTPMGILFDENAQNEEEVLQQVKSWGRPSRVIHQTGGKHFTHDNKVAYLITAASQKARLDQKLVELQSSYSRSQLAKFIKNGCVRVNGKTVVKTKELVNDDDVISLRIPQKISHDFKILFENNSILAIEKPAGILSHSQRETDSEWTINDFAKTRSKVSSDRKAIAHRLDRDTSGVILAAKTDQALDWLQQQFAQRKIKKIYYAVINKKPPHQQAIINLPIQRSVASPGKFEVSPNGRSAITEIKVIKQAGKHFLLRLKPKTGRTHQLRVHLSHIGCPIVGDQLYGGSKSQRMLLHASEIEAEDVDGKKIKVKSELPNEFRL